MAVQPTIVVIDYHKGNLSSVARGLSRAGAAAVISDDPAQIRAADGLVIPGVGSFYDAIEFMAESGQAAAVLDAASAGTPLLGICLGLQLLFDRGDEGVPKDAPAVQAADEYGSGLPAGTIFEAGGHRWVRGMGLLSGSCTRLDGSRLKVPHVGWDQVHVSAAGRANPLLAGFPEGANMYFTHSYAVDDDADPAQVSARTHYVRSFPCVVQRGTIFGCQFHPEKSSARGLDILRNFVAIAGGAAGSEGVPAVEAASPAAGEGGAAGATTSPVSETASVLEGGAA